MSRVRLVLLAVAVVACRENVTAPGACPEFCPTARLQVIDTILSSVIAEDESIRGYVQPHQANILQVANDGSRQLSRAIVRFRRFEATFLLDSSLVPAEQTDSFRLRVPLRRWIDGVDDLEVRVHRLPITIDSASTYEELTPYFADSTLLTSFTIPDSVPSDGITVALAADVFPAFEADSLQTAIGIAVASASAGWIDVASREASLTGHFLTWYVKIDSAGTLVDRQQGQASAFDSFLPDSVAPIPDDQLVVGGVPSARTFLRFALPESILKFSTISQASLLLVPVAPMTGATDDTVKVTAFGIAGDFGPKSRPEVTQSDSLARGAAELITGQADSIEIDVTLIVKPWQADTTLPRTLILLMSPEGGGLAELRLHSTRSTGFTPALRVTYVPFFTYEEPLE
jgi:hypothetical protein